MYICIVFKYIHLHIYSYLKNIALNNLNIQIRLDKF